MGLHERLVSNCQWRNTKCKSGANLCTTVVQNIPLITMVTQTLGLWLDGKTWRLHSTSTESRSPFSPEHTFCNFLPPLQIQTDVQHRYSCTAVPKTLLLKSVWRSDYTVSRILKQCTESWRMVSITSPPWPLHDWETHILAPAVRRTPGLPDRRCSPTLPPLPTRRQSRTDTDVLKMVTTHLYHAHQKPPKQAICIY
jgi:hypothetical protein